MSPEFSAWTFTGHWEDSCGSCEVDTAQRLKATLLRPGNMVAEAKAERTAGDSGWEMCGVGNYRELLAVLNFEMI